MYLNQAEHALTRSNASANSSNQRMESLKELLQLEQTRLNLTSSLNHVLGQIRSLQADLLHTSQGVDGLSGPDSEAFQRIKPHLSASGPTRRMRRGELRNRIVTFLKTAGPSGARVREIADALGMKPVNIHSWFHTATRRFSQIQRSGPGRYRLQNELLDGEPAAMPSLKKRRPRASIQKSRSKRGEVSRRILEVLENAAPGAVKVAEIAERVGANYRNVHVWLSSIGKRNPRIIRSGRGLYRIAHAPQPKEQH
jgi:predicted transcriptional regulator with HTH domain